MDIHRRIDRVQKEAHQGAYGQWRRGYCRSYRATADEILRQIRLEQRNFAGSEGATISCLRGCAYCCSHYISVSLGHGLLITDFLYSNPAAMSAFTRSYPGWRLAAGRDGYALRELERYTTYSRDVRHYPQELLDRYAALDVPCPFLSQKACSIYPVRPACCASHVSISPPGLCNPNSTAQPLICETPPEFELLRQLALLGEREMTMHQETLGTLVYRMLTEGLPQILKELPD
jgi:hypothetical protein